MSGRKLRFRKVELDLSKLAELEEGTAKIVFVHQNKVRDHNGSEGRNKYQLVAYLWQKDRYVLKSDLCTPLGDGLDIHGEIDCNFSNYFLDVPLPIPKDLPKSTLTPRKDDLDFNFISYKIDPPLPFKEILGVPSLNPSPPR